MRRLWNANMLMARPQERSAVLTAFVEELVRAAGEELLRYRDRTLDVQAKTCPRDIVTAADQAAEGLITELIAANYPNHRILCEESGFRDGSSDLTWVVDPLDGTANFAAGTADFGVIIGVTRDDGPWIGAMYLPVDDVLYIAEKGRGATRNGCPLRVTDEGSLENVLIDYSFYYPEDPSARERERNIFEALWPRVRGIRSSGSLRYLAQLADGQLGGFIAHELGLWDITGPSVILEEAGAVVTGLDGRPIDFQVGPSNCDRVISAIGASPALHSQIMELIGDRYQNSPY